MNIVVDTSVWSLALRRREASRGVEALELAELIREGRVAMLGPVRQEILSGLPSPQQYKTLRDYLRAFPDVALEPDDYEEAASFFSRCRAKGIQGSNTDFLICAVAARRHLGILTTDVDFAPHSEEIGVPAVRRTHNAHPEQSADVALHRADGIMAAVARPRCRREESCRPRAAARNGRPSRTQDAAIRGSVSRRLASRAAGPRR
jgi:predicted nucleic acid-binding protein